MNDLKNDAREFLERAKEKITPIMEDVKEKAVPVVEDIKEKTAPVITKAKDVAEDAIDAVKDGAEKISSLFEEKVPGMNVKNELFDELEAKAQNTMDAARAKAAEMQRRLEEMMGGKKDGAE